MAAIRFVFDSVNQRAPSWPAVISSGMLFGVGSGYSVIWPLVVIRPILLPLVSVNHRLLSGPTAMPCGLPPLGSGYSVNWPLVEMRAILLPSLSANQLAPSGPLTMSPGKLSAVGILNSVIPLVTAAWAMGTVRTSTPTSVTTMKLSLTNSIQKWDARIGVFLSESF